MSDAGIDAEQAAAEARLDRLDRLDEDGDEARAAGPSGALDPTDLDTGMHIEERDTVVRDHRGQALDGILVDYDSDEDADIHGARSGLAGVLDTFAEAFNARDLDTLVELCAEDCETPGLATDLSELSMAFEDLWERRPSCLLTRGELAGQPVGVVWELGETEAWRELAAVHVALDDEESVGVIEFADDPVELDRIEIDPPDGDLEEGTRWIEWEEGAE